MTTFTEEELMRASRAIYLACEEPVARQISEMLQFAASLVKKSKLTRMNGEKNKDWTNEKNK